MGICVGIGYQGKSLHGLCEELRRHRIELVIDVRARAWSQRPEFRKGKLSETLAGYGIGYHHAKDAGNPYRPRRGEQIEPRECMRQYTEHLKSNPQVVDGIRRLLGKKRVALLCYESESSLCHRGVLLRRLISPRSRRQAVACA